MVWFCKILDRVCDRVKLVSYDVLKQNKTGSHIRFVEDYLYFFAQEITKPQYCIDMFHNSTIKTTVADPRTSVDSIITTIIQYF